MPHSTKGYPGVQRWESSPGALQRLQTQELTPDSKELVWSPGEA